MSILLIILVAVVGYFVIKALVETRELPTQKKILNLQKLIDNLQPYLYGEYKKEVEQAQKEYFLEKEDFMRESSRSHLKRLNENLREFDSLISINSRLCERFRSDQDKLLAQLLDWAMLLEHYRDFQSDFAFDKALAVRGLDTLYDESKGAERRGKIEEIRERIKQRAIVERIPHKVLEAK